MSQQAQSLPRNSGWLSFSALFSDGSPGGVRSDGPDALLEQQQQQQLNRRDIEEQGDEQRHDPDDEPDGSRSNWASNFGEPGQYKELSDIRLDISDIQDAIKNHDLWVQDAVAMRSDIEELQAAVDTHAGWMRNLGALVRQLQEREDLLVHQITELRHQVQSGEAAATTAAGSRPVTSYAATAQDALFGYPTAAAFERLSTIGDDKHGLSEIRRQVMSLDHFLQGLRGRVDAIEARIDQEQVQADPGARRHYGEGDGLHHKVNGYTAQDSSTLGGVANTNGAGMSGISGVSTSTDGSCTAGSLGDLRNRVDALDKRMVISSAEVERMVLDLRAEIAALRMDLASEKMATSPARRVTSNHNYANHRAGDPSVPRKSYPPLDDEYVLQALKGSANGLAVASTSPTRKAKASEQRPQDRSQLVLTHMVADDNG